MANPPFLPPSASLRELSGCLPSPTLPHRPPALRAQLPDRPGQVVPAPPTPPAPPPPRPTPPTQTHKPATQQPEEKSVEQGVGDQATPEGEQRESEIRGIQPSTPRQAHSRDHPLAEHLRDPSVHVVQTHAKTIDLPSLVRQGTPRQSVRGHGDCHRRPWSSSSLPEMPRVPRYCDRFIDLAGLLNFCNRRVLLIGRDVRGTGHAHNHQERCRMPVSVQRKLRGICLRRHNHPRQPPRHKHRQHQPPAQVHTHNPHTAQHHPPASPLAAIPPCSLGPAHRPQSTRPRASATRLPRRRLGHTLSPNLPDRPPTLRADIPNRSGQVVPAPTTPPAPTTTRPTPPARHDKPAAQQPNTQRIEQGVGNQPTPEWKQGKQQIGTLENRMLRTAGSRDHQRAACLQEPTGRAVTRLVNYIDLPALKRHGTPRKTEGRHRGRRGRFRGVLSRPEVPREPRH